MHLHWARTELVLASSPAIFAAPDISKCQMEQFGANHPPVHTSVRSPPASFLPKHPPFSWLAYRPHQANPIQSLIARFLSNTSLLLRTPFSGRSCTTSHRPHLYRSAPAPPPLSCSFSPPSQPSRRALPRSVPFRRAVAAVPAPRRGRTWAAQGPAASRTPSLSQGMDTAAAAAMRVTRCVSSARETSPTRTAGNSRVSLCVSQGTRSHSAQQAQKGLVGAPEEAA